MLIFFCENEPHLVAFNQTVLEDIKNPWKKLIWMLESIEFCLPHHEILQAD